MDDVQISFLGKSSKFKPFRAEELLYLSATNQRQLR